MRLQKKLAGGFAALAIPPSAAHAAYIYAPGPEYETQEGDVNNVALNIYVAEKQWFFNSSLFGNSPMTINSVSFRLDKIVLDREFQRLSYELDDRFKLRVNTQNTTPSTVFADNLAGAVTVLSGAQRLFYNIGGHEGQTKDFTIHLNFTTPYVYDPRAGNLIVDIFQNPIYPAIAWDFVRNSPNGFRLYSRLANATGEFQAYLPVARFDVTYAALADGDPGGNLGGGPPPGFGAVPEPATWAMMIMGIAGVGAVMRRRRAGAVALA